MTWLTSGFNGRCPQALVLFHSFLFSLFCMLFWSRFISKCLSPPLILLFLIINMIGLVLNYGNVRQYICMSLFGRERDTVSVAAVRKDCSQMLKHLVKGWNQSGQSEHVHIGKIFVNVFVRNASGHLPKTGYVLRNYDKWRPIVHMFARDRKWKELHITLNTVNT